ncbi:methyltransferase domain-containing protein [Salinispirillum sp. LH 10-3-1]|uniref:Methyltransferase domain-containing protein n=1 Tax=Salinispirillum sp. LH 10-3-1 TaxID=2952525 RepID=A0AB38YCD0_9GAMM
MTQAKRQVKPSALPEYTDIKVLERQAVWHLDQAGKHDIGYDASNEHLAQAALLAEALAQYPEHRALAYNFNGRIALEKGQFDDAELFLTEAAKLSPKDPGIAFSRGHLALQRHRLSDAAAFFRDAIDIDPNATIADQSLAYVKYRSGMYAEAFGDYRKLVRKYPKNSALTSRLLECASQIKADYYDATLAADIINLLHTDNLDHQALAPLAGSLLIHRYELHNPNASIELHQLVQDELLIAALNRLLFVHPELDDLLASLRQTVLHHHLSLGHIDADLKPLLLGLAQYGLHNEFLLYQTPDEAQTIQALKGYLKEELGGQCKPKDLILPALLLSLYEPLAQKGLAWPVKALMKAADKQAQAVFHAHLLATAEEVVRANELEALTDIQGGVSQDVRAQYEDNPYPRWTHLPLHTPAHYARAVASEIPAFNINTFRHRKPTRVLIAGSGTGRHAIHMARHFHDVDVTAVDLSRRSLAYGQAMAERYGVDNIEFYQADILALTKDLLPEQELFDVIECSGVLHHMGNPMAGWEALTELLRPQGLMKVGLYSRRARTTITSLRRVIADQGFGTTPDDIRRFRHALLQQKSEGPDLKTITTSVDFYSMSGVRDLLFHAQEHVFSPEDLSLLIRQLPLEFLGFVLPPSVRRSYQHFFPDDQLMNDLKNWERLEIDNPRLFGGMYQMYLQKR